MPINANSSFQSGQFVDGEALILQESLTYGNTTISSGDTFGTLISSEATSTASAVSISEGIYYIRGHFVAVSDNTLILDGDIVNFSIFFDIILYPRGLGSIQKPSWSPWLRCP